MPCNHMEQLFIKKSLGVAAKRAYNSTNSGLKLCMNRCFFCS